MKTIISKILILVLVFNLIATAVVFSSDEVILYNRGEEIFTEYGLYRYNGDVYINESDLYLLTLEWDGNTLSDSCYTREIYITHGSSTVLLNGDAFLFPNVSVNHNGKYYISLRLIGMFLSEIYEVTDNIISLWTFEDKYSSDFVKGIISLPKNEIAPQGGIRAEVFVTYPDGIAMGSSSSGGGYGSETVQTPSLKPKTSSSIGEPGYNGVDKPSFNHIRGKYEEYISYDKLVSKEVVIEEGCNSAEFYLSMPGENFSHCEVGYYAEINGISCFDFETFSRKKELYEFVIETGKTKIKGTVNLSDICEEDTEFTVVADGKYSYKFEGVIPAGNKTADYTLSVDTYTAYNLTLYFSDGNYLRQNDNVKVYGSSLSGVDFETSKSNEYDVTVSLPEGYETDKDTEIDVYMQSAIAPYYYLDKKTTVIKSGNDSAQVKLTDDIASEKVIVYYCLVNKYDGLFDFGHYGKNGTSFDLYYASEISDPSVKINIELLKSKTITANITLPYNETAAGDIVVNIEPMIVTYPVVDSTMSVVQKKSLEDEGEEAYEVSPYDENCQIELLSETSGGASSGGGGGGMVIGPVTGPVTVAEPTIKKGEKSGVENIIIPDEEGYKYILEVTVIDGTDTYFRDIYYNAEKSTVIKSNATNIDIKTEYVNIQLMKQYMISGNINAVGYVDLANRITAICQNDDSIINDVYNAPFSVYTDVYGDSAYGIYVPSEFDKYIISLKSYSDGDVIYYKEQNCAESIDDAQIISVKSDMADIDFIYDGYNPTLPLRVDVSQRTDTERWNVSLRNISDFDRDNVYVRIAFYKDEKLQKAIVSDPIISFANETEKLSFTIEQKEIDNADVVKLFVWDNMLKPLSETVIIKDERTKPKYDDKAIALLYVTEGEMEVYSQGKVFTMDIPSVSENDDICVPARTFAETLNMKVDWDAANKEVIFYYGDGILKAGLNTLSVYFNEKEVQFRNEIRVINGRTMVPVRDIVELFGFITVFDAEKSSVSVYDKKNYMIKEFCDTGLIPNEICAHTLDEEINRKQMVYLLVNLYEKFNGEIEITEENPFIDINDEIITKAYIINLISGYEDGTFMPFKNLTNAEIIKIFQSLLIKSGIDVPDDFSSADEYADFPNNNNHWATNIVYRMKCFGVLDNVFGDKINIDADAKISDVLAICKNCYDILMR